MAETKLNDLPVTSLTDFTDNDRFLIVDDGKARQLPRTTFQTWLLANVQGEQGIQGVAGRDGVNGNNGINGDNGTDGLDAYQIAVSLGYVGTKAQWLTTLKGATGAKGADGFSGWTPQLKTTARSSDIVLEITDWFGGTGTNPTTLGYIGETGIVTNISNALNIRGTKGDKGDTGLTGATGGNGADGLDGKTVASIVFNADLSATVNYTDSSSVTSSTPPIQYGWGTYKDGQYTDVSPFNVSVTTQSVLPNTAVNKIEHLPTNYASFYNPTLQKYLLTDLDGFYSVRVKFKVAASAQPSTLNVSMSKATTDTPFSEDRTLRGDNKIQDMNFNTVVYGDEALSANGLTIYVKTYDREISIYNIEVTVAKLI